MDKQVGGVLYTADFAGCELISSFHVGLIFEYALQRANASMIPGSFTDHVFENDGYSASVLLKESHSAIHTWPEGKFVTFELFTCGETVNALAAINYLAEQLECSKFTTNRHPRFPENANIPR